MTAKVVLEQLGILKESVQPRRTNLKDTLQPVYEVDQPVGDLFLNEQEAVFGVNFRENPVDTNGVQEGPRITLSPLQFYSNFKPESLVPFDITQNLVFASQSSKPRLFPIFTVPSRKILILSSLVVSVSYRPDPTKEYYIDFASDNGWGFTDFYYNILSSTGTQYDATSILNTIPPTEPRSGFTKLNTNILQSGSVNRSLVYGETSTIRFELKTPGNAGDPISDYLPTGAAPVFFVAVQLQGVLITKSEYETYQNISKRPTALDFGPKQKDMEPPQLVERPTSIKQRRRPAVKRFK